MCFQMLQWLLYLYHEGGLKIDVQELVFNFSVHWGRFIYDTKKIEQLPQHFECEYSSFSVKLNLNYN
jgi:hypothetical protein